MDSRSHDQVRSAVEQHADWYHTMELAPGVVTPGWLDLRPVVDRMPWPDVVDKRCLDIGTFDGFLAFELERRGAAEVVATDVADLADIDWRPRQRERGLARIEREVSGPRKGFDIAKEALGSRVEKLEVSIYDLDPAVHGTFDVVVCGSLLVHLRDPLRGLEAVRSVCREAFLSADVIDTVSSLLRPRRPAMVWDESVSPWVWGVPSTAGHRWMLQTMGFDVLEVSRPYAVPFNAAARRVPPRRSERIAELAGWLLTRARGSYHQAVLCRPAI